MAMIDIVIDVSTCRPMEPPPRALTAARASDVVHPSCPCVSPRTGPCIAPERDHDITAIAPATDTPPAYSFATLRRMHRDRIPARLLRVQEHVIVERDPLLPIRAHHADERAEHE